MGKIVRRQCFHCSTKWIMDQDTSSACPYCGNKLVQETPVLPQYIPSKIAPFAISREEALKLAAKHCTSGWTTPHGYKFEADSIEGVYLPCYLFNCTMKGGFSYTPGSGIEDAKAIVKRASYAAYGRRKADLRTVFTEGEVVFENIIIDGRTKRPVECTNMLCQEALPELIDFDESVFSDCMIEDPNRSSDKLHKCCWSDLVQTAGSKLISMAYGMNPAYVRRKGAIGFVISEPCELQDEPVLCALPVWVVRYSWKGGEYLVVVNGSNGQVTGEKPFVPWKETAARYSPFIITTLLLVFLFTLGLVTKIPALQAIAYLLVALGPIILGLVFFFTYRRNRKRERNELDTSLDRYIVSAFVKRSKADEVEF